MTDFFKIRRKGFTDSEYVEGIKARDSRIQCSLYEKCREMFLKNTSKYGGLSFDDMKDLFQEAYIIMWEKMERGDIFSDADGVFARRTDGTVYPTGIAGFFMQTVSNKYHDRLRQCRNTVELDSYTDIVIFPDDDPDITRDKIVGQCVKTMPQRCVEILTMFYYEKKTLEEILVERMNNSSYDGLKTSKYKCVKKLKTRIREAFSMAGLKVPSDI
ncbi:RNA polymerase sigma factor [Xylanibacter muris]|uniref:Sigma-70 family RNA polymerase sigma factor n=1 Tax=Xylanibacter muris TaxID=2736290 RepID=A0ABX2AKV7_9BACT|nr:sigma-70 family RNA polymerase sigma factor [Xylanibacter muris]NPD91834.1 sigma-70 family RNA polymerase sigma factor [Xylanibacter muris]